MRCPYCNSGVACLRKISQSECYSCCYTGTLSLWAWVRVWTIDLDYSSAQPLRLRDWIKCKLGLHQWCPARHICTHCGKEQK